MTGPEVPNAPSKSIEELKSEIVRLEAKRDAVDDQDIQLAIQGRIDALQSQVIQQSKPAQPDQPTEVEDAPTAEALTDAQRAESEKLIRESLVAKRRGDKKAATELLQRAATIAPSSPTVLEALGDDLADRNRSEEAIKTYARAKRLDPHNVGLERKHALLVLSSKAKGSLLTPDALLPTSGDAVASLMSARLLTAFFPGLGHIVLGRTQAGIAFLAGWVVTIGVIIMFRSDLQELMKFAAGQPAKPTMIVLFPMLIAFIIYFAALGSLGGASAKQKPSAPERPKPPVDLPFE